MSRRSLLVGAGGGALTASLSGCIGGALGGRRPVEILAAGSLQSAFGEGLREAVDEAIRVEAHGSVTVARLVASGRRNPDIVALADTALFEDPLSSPWHAAFATNSLVVAYDRESPAGRRVGSAGRWFEPVLAGEASLGRTDPGLDPLGYRTLFALDLASEYYGEPALRERLLDREQIYPETALLSRFETGALDAAVVYRSMAVDRGYSFVDLPSAVDLGSPARAETYRTVSYTLSDGETIRGAPIAYGAKARSREKPVRRVFETLLAGEYLTEYGFTAPARFPTYAGEVPDGLGR